MIIRNLKALGLALVAVFAMSVMATSAASAATPGELTAPVGNITIDGFQVLGGTNQFTAFGQSIECPGATAHGEAKPPTTTITVTPTNPANACRTAAGLRVTITTNGCDTLLHIGETTGVAGQYSGTADLVCPVGQFAEMHIYASAVNENIQVCTIKMPPQNGLTGGTVTNTAGEGKKDLLLSGTVKNIHVEKSGICGSGTTTTAETHGTATAIATNAEGLQVDMEISH